MKKSLLVAIISLLACCYSAAQQINWQWGRGATGPGEQEGWATATDKTGNVYVTGEFSGDSITFNTTTLYYNAHPSGVAYNLYVVKYSPSGNLLWAKSPLVSDTGGILGLGIATDEHSNVFVTGAYSGAGVSFDSHLLPPTRSDLEGFFIVKYDSSGNALWANGAGGIRQDYGFGVATDDSGNAFVTGFFESDSIKFGASVLYRAGPEGSYNAFVAKYNAAGQALWAECPVVSGFPSVAGAGVATDGSGNVYETGSFQGSSVTFGNYTLQPVDSGAEDVYLVKLDGAGNVLWAKQTGGGYEAVNGICADSAGNVTITGGFAGSNIIFGDTQLNNNSASGTDYFLAKYDPSGNVLWARGSNGCYACLGYCVASDKCGNLYVGGGFETTQGYLYMRIADTTINTQAGLIDPVFIVTYSSAGQALCVSALASGGDDNFGISLDQSGNAYIGSDFESNNITLGSNTLHLTGYENVYVAKFNCPTCSAAGGCESLSYQVSSPGLCKGDSVLIHFTNVTGIVISPNAYVAWIDSSHAALFPDTTAVFTISGYLPCGAAAMQALTLTVQGDSVNVTSSKDTICSGDSALLCATPGLLNYLWNTNENTACIYVHDAGNYYVTASAGTNCSAISTPVFINEYPSPSVGILVDGDTLASYSAAGYQWFLNGAAISSATGSVYIASTGGSYALQITDTNGCTALSAPVAITGINNIEEDATVMLYPNPCSVANVQLSVSGELVGSALQIYDDEGQMVFPTRPAGGYSAISNQKSTITISDLPSGVYFLRISSANASITKKLVKL